MRYNRATTWSTGARLLVEEEETERKVDDEDGE